MLIAEKSDENETVDRVHAQPPTIPFLNGSDKFESSSSHQVALLKEKQMKGTRTPTSSDYYEKEEVDDDIILRDYSPPRTHPPTHKGK
ncbi:hypothetical protein CTI12_AA142680 [Artemisia annua]|uniref:Uncharacterized protein n=1 Tax=Artemisia annua TaxID=35608 RepID=A0A2U1PK77_ARTAN|nr:hypothetical protein CTI12_AA142680 [Artemisia annua]